MLKLVDDAGKKGSFLIFTQFFFNAIVVKFYLLLFYDYNCYG